MIDKVKEEKQHAYRLLFKLALNGTNFIKQSISTTGTEPKKFRFASVVSLLVASLVKVFLVKFYMVVSNNLPINQKHSFILDTNKVSEPIGNVK